MNSRRRVNSNVMLLLRFPNLTIAGVVLLLCLQSNVLAQHRLWRSLQHQSLLTFSLDCAQTSWYSTERLTSLVQTALRQNGDGPAKYGDRAFPFDLNGDGSAELFVPLTCGATGNCTWAVLSTRHRRVFGILGGQDIYVHSLRGRWPVLVTYAHVSAVEGSLYTYRFRDGRYTRVARSYAINHGNYELDVQGGLGHRLPSFLGRARKACEVTGY
jgi:hypothetical protein